MKNKSLNIIIPLVVYPFDVMVSVGETDIQFRKNLENHLLPNCRKDLDEPDSILNLKTCEDGRTVNFPTGYQTVIRLKNYPKTPREYGILAHEVFHAAAYIFLRMGIPFEIYKTDEIYAYLIDYLTTEVYKKL